MWHIDVGGSLTFLKPLEAFERDLKFVWIAEIGRIVQDLDAQEGDNGHIEICLLCRTVLKFVVGKTMLFRKVCCCIVKAIESESSDRVQP